MSIANVVDGIDLPQPGVLARCRPADGIAGGIAGPYASAAYSRWSRIPVPLCPVNLTEVADTKITAE